MSDDEALDRCTFYGDFIQGTPPLVRALGETFGSCVKGQAASLKNIVLVLEHEGGVSTYAWGDADTIRVLGLLSQSQRTILNR